MIGENVDAEATTVRRWIVFVGIDDRSGVLAALAERFAGRGVSFESFTTLTVAEGAGVMSIIFRGSDRIARVICRSIERLAVTQWTNLLPADDPGVRAVAVVAGAAPAIADGVVAPWGAGSFVLAGSFTHVEESVAEASTRGARLESITVLPPAEQ